MAEELGKISVFLAKDGSIFESVLKAEKVPVEGEEFKVRNFEFDRAKLRFLCQQKIHIKSNPPWLDFVNEQIAKPDQKINFDSYSRGPSGVLLIQLEGGDSRREFWFKWAIANRSQKISRRFRNCHSYEYVWQHGLKAGKNSLAGIHHTADR